MVVSKHELFLRLLRTPYNLKNFSCELAVVSLKVVNVVSKQTEPATECMLSTGKMTHSIGEDQGCFHQHMYYLAVRAQPPGAESKDLKVILFLYLAPIYWPE